jgi:DNA anti-recombination protein RmuC
VEEDGLDEYARLQNVCIASPNTFWAYVTSISQGLHGLEVERHAEEILSALQRISKDIRNFSQEEFRLLGAHLRNAAKQYDDAERKLREMRDGMASLERIEARQFKGEGVAL